MSLKAFLNPIAPRNERVVISKRFTENNVAVSWELRPILQDENEAIMKKHTKTDRKTGAENLNRTAYIAELTAAAVVYPDLKDAELQKAYGVLGEGELLKKMLMVGEYAVLIQKVQELSGLDTDPNDLVAEVKNA